jgi:hypothetical protein
MNLFSPPILQDLGVTAIALDVYGPEINNGCPVNISNCIGVCPGIFRNSEIVIKVKCHRMCSGCGCSDCREDRTIIDIHNPKKKTHMRKNITTGCYCAVKESKLITPVSNQIQG